MSIAAIAKQIGLKTPDTFYQIQRGEHKISTNIKERLLRSFPQLNKIWLYTGDGEPITKEENYVLGHVTVNEKLSTESTKKTLPIIPVEAIMGFPNGDVQVVEHEIVDNYSIPEFIEKGAKYLIRASGSSMYPKYSNGDLLACRPIHDLSFFQWGKVYVLDTDQGAIVKRLYPCKDETDCIECRSDNTNQYPPFNIKKDSIRKVSIVIGVIRME
ncbi:MAG: S24 family peptidase [Bacteroidota bacterium]